MIPAVAVFHLVSTGLQEWGAEDGKRTGPAGLKRKPIWKKRVRTGARGLQLKYSAGAITDKILCYGVDVDAYRASCQVPLFPDMWNTWELYRQTTTSDDLARSADKALAFMTWLNNVVLGGKIRHVTVEANGQRVGDKLDGEIIATPAIVTRETVCDVLPELAASDAHPPYDVCRVRFVYRGTEVGTPWPSYKLVGGVAYQLCPTGAKWMLGTCYGPSQQKVPDVKSDSWLPPYYHEHAPEPPGNWDLSTKLVLGGGVLLAVAVAAGYAVRSFR